MATEALLPAMDALEAHGVERYVAQDAAAGVAAAVAAKPQDAFRDYAKEARPTVKAFYRTRGARGRARHRGTQR